MSNDARPVGYFTQQIVQRLQAKRRAGFVCDRRWHTGVALAIVWDDEYAPRYGWINVLVLVVLDVRLGVWWKQ